MSVVPRPYLAGRAGARGRSAQRSGRVAGSGCPRAHIRCPDRGREGDKERDEQDEHTCAGDHRDDGEGRRRGAGRGAGLRSGRDCAGGVAGSPRAIHTGLSSGAWYQPPFVFSLSNTALAGTGVGHRHRSGERVDLLAHRRTGAVPVLHVVARPSSPAGRPASSRLMSGVMPKVAAEDPGSVSERRDRPRHVVIEP